MPYNQKLKKEIEDINSLIDNNKIHGKNEALDLFKQHISKVINLGRFSTDKWNLYWREKVYDFGEKFENNNPIDFLNFLSSLKKTKNKDQQEIIDFYYSEIEINSLQTDSSRKKVEELIEKYPYNPEFHYSLGHYYLNENNFKNAIEHYSFSLNKDKTNPFFNKSLFNAYMRYFEIFIVKSKYSEGLNKMEKLIKQGTFKNHTHYNNLLISFQQRFKDHILLNKKILEAEEKINEIVKNETNKGQNRIIELLGFFTAIIAFIFSTISIGKNFNFNEAIIFNISLGLTLSIFIILINLLFSGKKIETFDFRVLIIIVLIMTLLLIVAKFGINIWL